MTKAKGRVAPRLDLDDLSETFLEQIASGKACDAIASGATIPSIAPSRGLAVRVDGCLWRKVTLAEVHAQGLQMRDCRVEHSDLAQMNLSGASLERVEFAATRMTGSAWTDARLKSVLFQDCKLDFALMRMTVLTGCVFERCNLTDADFYGADLSGVILRGCDLSRADISQAKLNGADLRDCRLDGMRGLPAQTDGMTISPDQAALLISLFGVRVVW